MQLLRALASDLGMHERVQLLSVMQHKALDRIFFFFWYSAVVAGQ